jgi:YegS/Rv2252/BmrU family lipid kinase
VSPSARPARPKPIADSIAAAPPRRHALIIANPVAGRARSSRRRLDRIVAGLERRGCAAAARWTGPAPGDAERLAREAELDIDVVVAAGGDGTINAVANGLALASRDVPLAVLPFGTANVLAREIGLPRDPERLAALIAAGPARPVWPGRVGERLFLTCAGAGFDAATVAAVRPQLKRRFGRLAFFWAIAGGIVWYRAHEIIVRCDGGEYAAAAVIASKGRLYGGAWRVAPQASLAEPTLDLVLFRRSGRFAALRYLSALPLGRLPRRDDVTVLRCRSAGFDAAEPVPVQADGEIVGQLPVTLGIAERPLYLVQP